MTDTEGHWMSRNWNRLSDLTFKRARQKATAQELEEISIRINLQNMFSCGNGAEAVRLVQLSFRNVKI